jgi:CBS domain-containing protein
MDGTPSERSSGGVEVTMRRYRRRPLAKVRSLMKPGLPAADPSEPLAQVAGRMRADRVGAMAVMDRGGLVGIITERDLLRAMADGMSPVATHAGDCMTAEPWTIGSDEEAVDAAEKMLEHGIRHLPVVEEGRVVGLISARDLLELGRRVPLDELSYEPW